MRTAPPTIPNQRIAPRASTRGFLKVAIKIGWRDFRQAPGKFAFLIISAAAAVAVVTAISDLSNTVRHELVVSARQWLAADIQVRLNQLPS